MKRTAAILAIGAALVVGLLIGRVRSSAPQVEKTPARSASQPRIVTAPRGGIDRLVLRAELRRALVQDRSDATPHPVAPPADVRLESTQGSVEQQNDREAGSRLVDDAVSRGNWTASHRSELLRLLPTLGQGHLQRVLARLAAAINRGDVVPDRPGLLL